MDVTQEIHSINTRITEITTLVNSLVRKLGNIAVLKNQQENDKATVDNLASEVDKLADVVGDLNTNIATMNGIAKGKQLMWFLFGGLICAAVIGLVTTVIIHNSKLATHDSEISKLQEDVKTLKGG